MIRVRHAIKLARTKLHSKPIVLLVSVVTASLLFAILIATISIFTAAEKSATNFIKKANDNSYRVEVSPVIPPSVFSYSSPLSSDDITEIRAFEKEYYADLRATYKQAGVTYDPSSEIPALTPSAFFSPTTPLDQRFEINRLSPVIDWAMNRRLESFATTAKNTVNALKAIGAKYGASGYYVRSSLKLSSIPNMMLIQNNKEDFNDNQMKAGDMSTYGYFINSLHNGTYQFEDARLLQRYILPHNSPNTLKGIPVIISAQEAVALFGSEKKLSVEPTDISQRAAWLQDVQSKMNNYTYQSCYRNAPEMAKIQKVQRDYAEMENNKDNKDYHKPSLIYNLPTAPCGDVSVQSDARTSDEKKNEEQVIKNQQKLGLYEAPLKQLLTFQIIGVIDAHPFSKYTDDIQSYLQNLLMAESLTSSVTIPRQYYDALPTALKINPAILSNDSINKISENNLSTHVLDFPTISQARNFINQETCPSIETNCKKLFTSSPYGSNYLILDEIGKLFQKTMLYIVPIILGLATLVIWVTMARVMIDSRKETAIYRAMGAKRRDIAATYLLYGLLITVRIALVALIAGIVISFVVDCIYGPQLTNIAGASSGILTNTRFSLFNPVSPLLWLIVGTIFLVSFIATLQPLIRNVRRSPIKDMRDE